MWLRFGNNCRQSYKKKRNQCWPFVGNRKRTAVWFCVDPSSLTSPPQQTLSLYNVNLLPLCSGPVQVFSRKSNIYEIHPLADTTTAEELVTIRAFWTLYIPACPCPSLSHCPTPATRWHHGGWQRSGAVACSSQQSQPGALTHTLPVPQLEPRAWWSELRHPARNALQRSHRGQLEVSNETTNSNTVWKQTVYRCIWRRLKHRENVQRNKTRNESTEVTQLHFVFSSHQLITWLTSSAARLLQMFSVRNPRNESI